MYAGVASFLGAAGQFASGVLAAEARRGEVDDQIRQMNLKKMQVVGLATARAGASGLALGSKSTQEYLASLAGSFNDQMRQMNRSADDAFNAELIGAFAGALGGTMSAAATSRKESGY